MRNSGFELALPRNFSRQLKGDRFQLIPSINGEDGEPMEWVRHPRLPIPNDSLIEKVGGGGREGFLRVGFEFLGHLIHKANLLSLSRVLDVGCGVGRVAYALSHYLDPDATYEGFDVCEKSIDWANREIGGLHPNFAFKRIDLQHDLYNPKGVVDPLDFQFPYEENSFDLVFLASVFTHMSAIEIRTYFK
jgi:SAM-dependent methyltransferase